MQIGSETTFFWGRHPRLTLAWGLLLGLSVVRGLYSGCFPLSADETYYWQWSRYPALGYHDHPPMVAWLIGLSTQLLGTHEAAVRLPAILALAGAGAYLIELARRWYGERVALAATALAQSLLLLNAGALIVTPDSFQILAWAGACYHVARGYEDDHGGHWCLGGLWFGLGMMSKLSMAIFAPLAILYGAFSPRHRERLLGWRPYLGFALGLALMLPLIAWNLDNGWRAFRHAAHQGGVASDAWFVPRYLGDYLAGQLALLTPVVFLLFVGILSHTRRLWRGSHGGWMDRYLWITAAPVFVLFTLLSTHTRVEGNWPAFGYLGALLLITAGYHRRPIWRWTVVSAAAISLGVSIQVIFPVVPLPANADRIAAEFADWRPVGRAVAQAVADMPDVSTGAPPPFIFAMTYQTASRLAFYTPGRPLTVAINTDRRPNTYDYWWTDEMLVGRDAIGISNHEDLHEWQLGRFFESVDPPVAVPLHDSRRGWDGGRALVKTLYLYRACGFKGGHRWAPGGGDIRLGQPQPVADGQ